MRDRALKYGIVVLALVALIFPACASSGVKGDVKVPKTKVGTMYTLPDGQLKLVRIEGPSADRTMTFYLRNKSGTPIEDVTARVLFHLPPPAGSVQAFGTDAKDVTFSSFAGEDDFAVTVTPTLEGEIVGWKLLVRPAATVSAEGEARGSMFLGESLECTGIVNSLTAEKPAIAFEVKNVSGEPQELLEYQVRLTKGSEKWDSPWRPIPGKLQPGGTVTLSPDVSAADVTGSANVLLKIQRSSL
jgi:hypothetical protein